MNETITRFSFMVLCIVASYNAYPVEDATTVACTTLYAVVHATAMNFNIWYQMLKFIDQLVSGAELCEVSRS